MFVGETGVQRIVQRACEIMREHDTDDVRAHGAIDLATIQRYINFHYSVSLDLFGQELSTNSANYYTAGLKGRYQEEKIDDDHLLGDTTYDVPVLNDGRIETAAVPALTALNERLRDDYASDCARGVARWNKVIKSFDIDAELHLPHRAFNRQIGVFADDHFDPAGRPVSDDEWRDQVSNWLPTDEDRAYVASLMQAVTEPGRMANWVAPPARGVNGQPVDYEYVRLS